ncbi:hypothetical protein RND81_02G199300 [Saponaria officinalis]|uniref:Retrotransposon Copia-like N-terminal domain-containing protein n=1 Tax=Saponaria officinalis TaxID=3572 RepID=A0AAW1MUU8_SAPOF
MTDSDSSSGDERASATQYTNPYDDPFYLTSSDFPGMQIVSAQFNGRNYLHWSRGVTMALSSKNKLGFVTGKTAMPSANSSKFQQWIRCDSMVRCWLINSMIPAIKDVFMMCKNAKQIWTEVQERYGQSNGPLLFQLKKDLRNISQENDSIADY